MTSTNPGCCARHPLSYGGRQGVQNSFNQSSRVLQYTPRIRRAVHTPLGLNWERRECSYCKTVSGPIPPHPNHQCHLQRERGAFSSSSLTTQKQKQRACLGTARLPSHTQQPTTATATATATSITTATPPLAINSDGINSNNNNSNTARTAVPAPPAPTPSPLQPRLL